MVRYLLFLLLLASVTAFALEIGVRIFPSLFFSGFILPGSIYFLLLTAIFHFGLVKASSGKPALFIRYYMAATSFKLLIHMMLLVVLALFYKAEIVRLTVTFLVFYLFFTVFEVAQAYRHSRRSSN